MSEQPKTRNAATVILLRDAETSPEVFMMERHIRSDFVGGAHVFPGGKVDAADDSLEDLCAGLDDRQASSRLHLTEGGLAYFVAAIRECYEEAGVLLAYGDDGQLLALSDPKFHAHIDEQRSRLNARDVDFVSLVREEGWRLATDHMHYWAHWITPEGQPRRFDTRFFLATAPANQVAVHDDHELTASDWITPQGALEKAETGEWTIIFPTLRNLMALTDFSCTDDAERAARRRGEVETVQPRILKSAGGIQVVLPGDDGWEEAAPRGSE